MQTVPVSPGAADVPGIGEYSAILRKRRRLLFMVALPIAAIPESILVWPQAISQNGSAVLITPSTTPAQPKSRRQRTACRKPRFATRTAPSAADAKSSRPVMVAAGERSSIAISMNMNDEPQIRARTSRRGT